MSRTLSTYPVTYLNGMGVVASGRRKVYTGSKWDRFYPQRTPKEVQLGTGNSYFTLDEMVKRIKTDYHEAQKIADKLYDPNLNQFLKNIFQHVYSNFQYKPDPRNREQIKGVGGSYYMRLDGIDCDDMAFLIGTILYAKGVTFALRKIAMNSTGDFSHVYVVVPKSKGLPTNVRANYHVVDPVLDTYDFEYPENQVPKYYDEVMVTSTASMNGLTGLLNGIENYNLDTKEGWEQLRNDVLMGREDAPEPYTTQQFIERVSELINVWDVPEVREYTIEQLHEEEDEVAAMQGLDGRKKFFKNALKKVKKTVKKIGKTKVAKIISAPVKFAAKVTTAPLRLAAREGIKLWFKKLGKKKAKSLWPGLYSQAQAQAKGIDLSDWRKRQDNWEKVKKIFKGLGGNPKKLAWAIHDGAKEVAGRKSWFLSMSEVWNNSLNEAMYYEDDYDDQALNGMGEVATATATAAASTFIAAILKILNGTSDDPKVKGVTDLVNNSKELFDKISEKKDQASELINKVSPGSPQSQKQSIIPVDEPSIPVKSDPNPGDENFWDKNKNAILIGGGSVLAIGTAALAYSMSKKKKSKKLSGIDGTKKKSTSKKTSTTKKSTSAKRRNKTITI